MGTRWHRRWWRNP
jgi:hypothetical protein